MENFNEGKSIADIKRALSSIARRGAEWNNSVHDVICKIATHAKYTGDCSKMDTLLNVAMKGTVRRMLVVKAVMERTPIVIAVKKGAFHANLAKPGSKNDKPYDLDGLRANPWFERKEVQRDPEAFSFEVAEERAKKLADTLRNRLKRDDEDLTPTEKARVKALIDGIMATCAKAEKVEALAE